MFVRIKWVVLVCVIFAGVLWSAQTEAAPYYNSSETGCDGSDSTVLFCDDFEDGSWYATDCDTSGGITNAANDGWCGTIFANPITPTNAVASGVTPFGTYAAHGGVHSGGAGGVNMAQHRLKTASCGTDGSQFCNVSEIYVRWYAKWVTGYSFGAEKHLNVTNSDGDIAFANVQLNCGFGSAASDAIPYIQIIHGESLCQAPNQSSITLQSGRWYFFEFHVIAHATNGTVELWINDCGADGTSCGASPVLRTRLTGQRLPGNGNGSQIQTIWLENWANPGSTGTGPYWDQIKASTVGPIGFTGESGGGGGGGGDIVTGVSRTMRPFIIYVSQAGISTISLVLQAVGVLGYVWARRAAVVRAAVTFWRYASEVPTPKEMYWAYRYKKAVKRWQQQAPLMLPEPMETITIRPVREHVNQERVH